MNRGMFVPFCWMLACSSVTIGDPIDSPRLSANTYLHLDSLPSLHPMAKAKNAVHGDTILNSSPKLLAFLSNVHDKQDYGSITIGNASPVIACFGGGISAGVSNGGLYRESQLFSYPNLVARQMGIKDFGIPLFAESEPNGTGFMVFDKFDDGLPRWKNVTNGVSKLVRNDPPGLTPFNGPVNNWAVPGGGVRSLSHSHRIDDRVFPKWFPHHPYLWRFMAPKVNEAISAIDFASKNHPYHLVFLEDYFDEWIYLLKTRARFSTYDFYGSQLSTGTIDISAVKKIAGTGKKGVLFTVPRFQDLAFFKWYSVNSDRENVKAFVEQYKSEAIQDSTKPKYFLPSEEVDKLFSGQQANLSDLDVITEYEEGISDPEWQFGHNKQLRRLAEESGLALVDLSSIYSKISNGEYVTDDGLKIDGSAQGNFFSSDGIYPTAIGQAVIANEVIKALNLKYDSKIPLINVTELARLIQ